MFFTGSTSWLFLTAISSQRTGIDRRNLTLRSSCDIGRDTREPVKGIHVISTARAGPLVTRELHLSASGPLLHVQEVNISDHRIRAHGHLEVGSRPNRAGSNRHVRTVLRIP